MEALVEPKGENDENAPSEIASTRIETHVAALSDQVSPTLSPENKDPYSDGTRKDDEPFIDEENLGAVGDVKDASDNAKSEAPNQPTDGGRNSQARISILSKFGTVDDDELKIYTALTRDRTLRDKEDKESNDKLFEKEEELQQNDEEVEVIDLEGSSDVEYISNSEIHSTTAKIEEPNEDASPSIPHSLEKNDGDYSQMTSSKETAESSGHLNLTQDSKTTDVSSENSKLAVKIESENLPTIHRIENVADDLEILDLEDCDTGTEVCNANNDESPSQAIKDNEEQEPCESHANFVDTKLTTADVGEENATIEGECPFEMEKFNNDTDLEAEVADASLAVLHDSGCLEMTNEEINTANFVATNEKLYPMEESCIPELQSKEEGTKSPAESCNADDKRVQTSEANEIDNALPLDDSIDKSFDPNASQFANTIENDVETKVTEIIERAYEAATISLNASMNNENDSGDDGSELFIKSPFKIFASGEGEANETSTSIQDNNEEFNHKNEDYEEDQVTPLVTDLIESSFDHPDEEEQSLPSNEQPDKIVSLESIDLSCIDHDITTSVDLVDVTTLEHQGGPNDDQTSLREHFRSSINGAYGNGGNSLQLQRAQSVKVIVSGRCSNSPKISSSRPTSAPIHKVEDSFT